MNFSIPISRFRLRSDFPTFDLFCWNQTIDKKNRFGKVWVFFSLPWKQLKYLHTGPYLVICWVWPQRFNNVAHQWTNYNNLVTGKIRNWSKWEWKNNGFPDFPNVKRYLFWKRSPPRHHHHSDSLAGLNRGEISKLQWTDFVPGWNGWWGSRSFFLRHISNDTQSKLSCPCTKRMMMRRLAGHLEGGNSCLRLHYTHSG